MQRGVCQSLNQRACIPLSFAATLGHRHLSAVKSLVRLASRGVRRPTHFADRQPGEETERMFQPMRSNGIAALQIFDLNALPRGSVQSRYYHPYFWAAFVPIGGAGPVSMEGDGRLRSAERMDDIPWDPLGPHVGRLGGGRMGPRHWCIQMSLCRPLQGRSRNERTPQLFDLLTRWSRVRASGGPPVMRRG